MLKVAPFLFPLILSIASAGELNLDSTPDAATQKVLADIERIIASKKVPSEYPKLINYLKSERHPTVFYRCSDALATHVAPEVVKDLLALVDSTQSNWIHKHTALWLSLASQARVVTDAQVNQMLEKKDKAFNWICIIAGVADISQATREKILSHADRTEQLWCGSVITFIEIELGKSVKYSGGKNLSEDVRSTHLKTLERFLKPPYQESEQFSAAILLLSLGQKQANKWLLDSFEQSLKLARAKKTLFETILQDVTAINRAAGTKFNASARSDNDREKVILECIEWLKQSVPQ